ncbi:hypothetical protein Tco_1378003 [Tanacetum coccineum]
MERGFPIFLAHVTAKEVEDKSEKKRLEDVPIVQDFPEVFPEDLPVHQSLHYLKEAKISSHTVTLQERFGRCVDAKRKGDFLCITQSKKFHEKNYTTHDLELGAVVSLSRSGDIIYRN